MIVHNGRSEAADFIETLPKSAQMKLLRLIERVAASDNGPFDLKNAQKFKRLEDDLFELKSDQVRLLMFVDPPSRTIVTHGFRKKTQRTPAREIERARLMRDLYRKEAR